MKPWSYSTLNQYETCPRQFHEIKVLKKFVEAESVHQLWGKEVHTAFEEYIKSKGEVPLPLKMDHWRPLTDKLLAMPTRQILTEVQVALNKNFKSVNWDSEECWTRGVIDLLALGDTSAVTLDWKTGKRRPTQQLKLYAAYVFALYPEIDVVHTALVWLQEKRIDKESIARSETPAIWQEFIERAARLESAYERDSWPEYPNGLCKAWCPVIECKYNGRRVAI